VRDRIEECWTLDDYILEPPADGWPPIDSFAVSSVRESFYELGYAAGTGFHGNNLNVTDPDVTRRHSAENAYAIDLGLPQGTPILAQRSGIVSSIAEDEPNVQPGTGWAHGGNWLYVRHQDGTFGAYHHLAHNGALVSEGALVRRGQEIALTGATGSSVAHLHFEVTAENAPDGWNTGVRARYRARVGSLNAPENRCYIPQSEDYYYSTNVYVGN
jgi:murein DD-endopeptidase MepM/ murein hydrolase activator NlpD